MARRFDMVHETGAEMVSRDSRHVVFYLVNDVFPVTQESGLATAIMSLPEDVLCPANQ
jgi:hypothetical protein